ncbi:hypothetical protein KKA09_04315 [Patescibacteria group bacterium]|nr:hypothetical protein [Patescibacteria group bacterium]
MTTITTLFIPQKIEKEVKEISQGFGLSKEDFIINAILFYLKNLEKKIELKKELETWEKISNDDLLKFEKSI